MHNLAIDCFTSNFYCIFFILNHNIAGIGIDFDFDLDPKLNIEEEPAKH